MPAAMRLVTVSPGPGRRAHPQRHGGDAQAGGWTLRITERYAVRLLGDDVAVLAYKVKELLTVDGKSLTVEAADSSTWVRREGVWVCALHTEALLGDPFGRDKRPAPLRP